MLQLKQGRLTFGLHPGQQRAMDATARMVIVLAGSQSGKTVLGPIWLLREVLRQGPGDYLAVAPSYPLLAKKALPALINLFVTHLGWCVYRASRRALESVEGCPVGSFTIYCGYAANPESLESATAKAAWLDEAGQKWFTRASYDAILRRLAISRGRCLITTTPYASVWLEQLCISGEDVEVINFPSIENPAFSTLEFEERRRTMPAHLFESFYLGKFSRSASMVYSSFTDDNLIERFDLPPGTPRYIGLDFGAVNLVAVYAALVDDRFIVYRTRRLGSVSVASAVAAILEGEPEPALLQAAGGAASEANWRREFTYNGLFVATPKYFDRDVGISAVWGLFQQKRLVVFRDCSEFLAEIRTYLYEVGETGLTTGIVQDASNYHIMDATRYLVITFAQHSGRSESVTITEQKRW